MYIAITMLINCICVYEVHYFHQKLHNGSFMNNSLSPYTAEQKNYNVSDNEHFESSESNIYMENIYMELLTDK